MATPRDRGRPAADLPPPDSRIPPLGIVAAVLGLVGALPPAFLAVIAVALGGLSADAGPDPWTYLLLLAPLLQVWGAVWLLARRSWLFLVLAVVPVAALAGAVVWAATGTEDAGNAALPLLLLVAPLLAAVLAATPRVRRWVAARPRRTR
ncbi:hypothetical protein [Geodermatophilus poikilotrophus]|uniref:Uncharacterized protein n=1 Tax=Geodermatophilus poikilotrophus TaxID=1333667 RepID=A0A1I0B4Q3_9ACTN|nr:hypothetical protein [Geodermatophilus poikilotrophus]SET01767.1 hypothetical protein SAMN04488546_1110 [Geodermatophilus poikilotrophus]